MKMETVVVGCDGSDNARLALEAACELISSDGVVHVVTAYDAPTAGEINSVRQAVPEEFRDNLDLLQLPRQALIEAEAYLADRTVDHKAHFVEDHAASAILQVAEDVDADLIVVGSRGLGAASRFLRGSVSSRVANHAKTSFLVVHEEPILAAVE